MAAARDGEERDREKRREREREAGWKERNSAIDINRDADSKRMTTKRLRA